MASPETADGLDGITTSSRGYGRNGSHGVAATAICRGRASGPCSHDIRCRQPKSSTNMLCRERSLRVKNRMRVIRSSRSVRGGAGNVPAYSAECKLNLATLGELAIAGIAVDLQDPLEACTMGDWSVGFPIGRIDIGDAWRIDAAPWPVVRRIGPELTGLGAPAEGIKHRHRRFIGEQLWPLPELPSRKFRLRG